ncbi:MAG: galactose-1-phosphate uridylyltransferase [Anaerolineae bacterium]
MTGEIRQNKATKQWVIYAPARRKRPRDFQRREEKRGDLPILDKECPFCPGNESMLPAIIMELPGVEPGQWQTRVVPNKFPALTHNADSSRYTEGIYLAMPGYGRHEVIIDSPRHDQNLAEMSLEEVGIILETYHRRYVHLMKEHGNMMAIIFRNHGSRAGTSLMHPHSQLVVTGIVPHYIRWREEEAQRYFDEWGCCVYCDILDFEMHDRRRILLENESFLAFIPFAAEVPFEIWIMPKKHRADFGQITDKEKADLAFALRDSLARLHKKLQDPDYNYVINTSARYRADEPQLHWYLQIWPRLTTRAGFEIGSGININPSIPEEDADFLNEDATTKR